MGGEGKQGDCVGALGVLVDGFVADFGMDVLQDKRVYADKTLGRSSFFQLFFESWVSMVI
jgi:hypothetical protein